METGVGIDLQKNKANIAVLRNNMTLKSHHTVYACDKEELIQEVKRVFHQENIPKHNVSISVSVQDTILRKFSVDFTNRQQIDDIIFYETENHLFVQDIDKFIVDYMILQTEKGKTKLSVAAVNKQVLQEQLEVVENCHIHPFIVDIDIFGLFYLFQLETNYSSKNCILMQLEDTKCHFLLIKNGKVQDARKLIMANSLLDDNNSSMGVTTELKLENIHQNENVDIEKYSTRVLRELKKTLLTTHIEEVHISGEPCLAEAILKSTTEHLKINCQLFDTKKYIKTGNDKQELHNANIAIGLALRSLRIVDNGFNFRKAEFSYTKSFSILQKPILVLFTCIFLLLLSGNLFYLQLIPPAKQQYENLVNNAVAIHQRNFVKKIKANYWSQVPYIKRYMKRQKEQPRIPVIADLDILWMEVSEIIDKVRRRYYIVVDRVELNQKEIVFSGRTNDDTCLDLVYNFLQKKEWVAKERNGQKVLDSGPIRDPKDKKLTQHYRYYVKLQK